MGIDSIDLLNFVLALQDELGIDVPEADHGKLRTLESGIASLGARQGD